MGIWTPVILLLVLVAVYFIWQNRVVLVEGTKRFLGGGGKGGGTTPGKPL
jgi:hypothetical protein